MLDAAARYRVTEIRPEGVPDTNHRAPLLDAIGSAEGASFDGAWLAHAGLPVPRGHAETAWIVRLQRENAR
jgi:alpha-galactosidase